MEESRGGGEVRKIHIVYFLCHNGKMDHPHLLRVNHTNRHGVHLRDVKRWLSQSRGEEMPECFAWSYKRRYRGGYVWQDLVDDDLVTAIADDEYVLKGSLFPSLTKTVDPLLNREKSPIEQQGEEREQLSIDDNILSSEVMNSTDRFFRIGSIWLQETNQGEKENSTVAVVNKKKIESESELIKSNGNGRKATNVMRNFIGCMTVETKASALRAVEREDSSVSGSSHGSNSSKSARSSCSTNREKPATEGMAPA